MKLALFSLVAITNCTQSTLGNPSNKLTKVKFITRLFRIYNTKREDISKQFQELQPYDDHLILIDVKT